MIDTDRCHFRQSVRAEFAHEWTTRSKPASRRQRGQIRHDTIDRGELAVSLIEPWNGAQQPYCIRMLRSCKQHVDGRALNNLARIHDGNLIAKLGYHAKVVGNENYCDAGGSLQIAYEIEDLRLNSDVECRRWLICDQQ